MHKKANFKTSFLALVANETTSDHPAAEALVAYRVGQLTAEERAEMHRHLDGCDECATLARDFDLFAEPTPFTGHANEIEVASFLRLLKPQLTTESAPKPSWFWPLAVAASLILAASTSWWLSHSLTQRQMLAEMSRPRGNVSVLDLVAGQNERSGSPDATVELVAAAGGVLILTPDHLQSFPTYQAKILDSEGTLVGTIENLERDPRDDTFTLWIPPRGLALGDYRVELQGLSEKGSEVIDEYQLRLVGPAEVLP